MMKALCFEGTQIVRAEDRPDPSLQEDSDAIIRVETAGLCGSDLHPFFGRESGLDLGTVMGHEFVGRVVETGNSVEGFANGDRVCAPFTTNCGECFYCRTGLTSRCDSGQLFGWVSGGQGLHGGQAEYVRVPLADSTLLKIPQGMSDETALLLGDNLSTAYFGTDLAFGEQNLESKVCVVVGCGTVGLLAITTLLQRGASHVIALEPDGPRRLIAENLGAIVCENPGDAAINVSALNQGRGADAVLEFVGLPEAQEVAFRLVRPGGTLATVGCHCHPNFAFSPADAYDKNLSFRTGRCPARHYMNTLPDWVQQSDLDLSWCITHQFKIDDGAKAYDIFANRKESCVKAVLKF